jgi:hypothetical protein
MRGNARWLSLLVLATLALLAARSGSAGQLDFRFAGPERSPDGLALSDLRVDNWTSPPHVGELINVRFKLTNVSGQPLQLGDKGIFLVTRWRNGQENLDRVSSPTKKGALLAPGAVVEWHAYVKVDHVGSWSLWPSYETLRRAGPEGWHACPLEVVEAKRWMRRLGYCADVEKLPHGVALLGLTVFGLEGPRVGDEVTVEYHLQNRKPAPLTFDAHGVYVVAKLGNNERAFGYQLGGGVLAPDRPDKVLAVEAKLKLDAPGEWRFRPVMEVGGHLSPADWCDAVVMVAP